MTIDYMFQFLQFMARKNQVAQITPNEFQFAVNASSKDFYYYLIGQFEEFKPGKPVPTVAVGMSLRVAERLRFFKKGPIAITISNQLAPYPTDFYALLLLTDSNNKRIERIDDSELPSRLNSFINPIGDGFQNCYVESATGWTVYPSTVASVLATYYKLPVQGVWAYITDAQGRPLYTTGIQSVPVILGGSGYTSATVSFSAPAAGGVQATGTVTITGGVITAINITNPGAGYNNLTPTITLNGIGGSGALLGPALVSMDLEWDDISCQEIIGRACRYLGYSFYSRNLVEFGEETKSTGT